MTKGEGRGEVIDLKGLLARDEDFIRATVEALVQAALEAEMTEAIGAAKGERSETRVSYRSGYYSRSLITRVGTPSCPRRARRLGPTGHGSALLFAPGGANPTAVPVPCGGAATPARADLPPR